MKLLKFIRKPIPEIILLLAISVLSFFYIRFTYTRFEKDEKDDILQVARSIAATFPLENLKVLEVKPGDTGKPQYQVVKKILKEIIRVNPEARFAYIYAEQNGKIFFMADSEPEDSKDYSPPGQEYTEAKHEDFLPFRTGKELFSGPTTDRWGTWRSVLIPLKDGYSGKTIGVLGLDFSAQSWDEMLLYEIIESSVLTFLLFLAILLVIFISVKNDSLRQAVAEHLAAEEKISRLNETLETRIAERTSELETINRELAIHTREIEQFTYIASHDLQEPLRTLTNFTQLIQEEYAGNLDANGNKYIEFIYNSAGRMNELVNGLLTYALLGKERMVTLVDCNIIVEEVLDDLADSIKESGADISVTNLPMVNGYPTELRLLFQNLINNAIKFRKKNVPVVIKVSAEIFGLEWLFSVEDNGIGINEKDAVKIFDIFKRMHNRNEYAGTGIGLAHCKKIVELHGGKIWVEPGKEVGATFMFTIPAMG